MDAFPGSVCHVCLNDRFGNGAKAVPAKPHPKVEAYHKVVKKLKSLDTSGLHCDVDAIVQSIRRAVEQHNMFRAASLCALAVKSLGGGDVLGQLAAGYKPYTNRGSLDEHLLSVRRCVLWLSLSPNVKTLAALADACIRAAMCLVAASAATV